ncbi:hypothetical protein Tco_0707938 [Tanacetum coccineum]
MVNDSTTSSGVVFIPRIPVSKYYVSLNKWDPESRVYWGQKEPPQKSISSSSSSSSSSLSSYHVVLPEYWDIHEKIKSAFYDVNLSPYKGLILQFWALVKTTTHGKAAQMNNFPEVIMDLTVYKGVSFYNKAISCGLTTCIILPVFYLPPQAQYDDRLLGRCSCCLKKRTGLISCFNQLNLSLLWNVGLGGVGFRIYPYENTLWLPVQWDLDFSLCIESFLTRLRTAVNSKGRIAKFLGGQGPVSRKRKLSELSGSVSESESQTDYESDLYSEEGEEDHDVIIKIIEESLTWIMGEYELRSERATLDLIKHLNVASILDQVPSKRRRPKRVICVLVSTLE